MNSEEFEKLCDELRAQYSVVAKNEHPDATDEEIDDMCNSAIMSELWDMFKNDKISEDELVKMAGQLGFEPAGDLAKENDIVESEGDSQSVETPDGKEIDISAEAIKEAQGYDDDGASDKEDYSDKSDDKDIDDEDKERKEARKLYGFED